MSELFEKLNKILFKQAKAVFILKESAEDITQSVLLTLVAKVKADKLDFSLDEAQIIKYAKKLMFWHTHDKYIANRDCGYMYDDIATDFDDLPEHQISDTTDPFKQAEYKMLVKNMSDSLTGAAKRIFDIMTSEEYFMCTDDDIAGVIGCTRQNVQHIVKHKIQPHIKKMLYS